MLSAWCFSEPETAGGRDVWPVFRDRVGGRVTPPVRPHHRAYGSVHGGSSAPLQIPELSQKVQESPHRKQAIVHGRMHVRGPRVPPGASPGGGGLARTRSLESQCDHFATPSLRFLPLLPQDFAEAPANPLIQFVERVCHCGQAKGFLTQMCARFSPQQVSHAVERGCGCARARESAVKSSIAQSTAACTGPAFGGGPARRQPVPPQGAEALAFTGQRTMNTRGTRPGLSPTFYRWAEPSLTVQPLGTGRPLVISAVYRGPDFPRACSSSPDTDGVLQPRKSMTMFDLLAMEPAKAAPIPERNRRK